jgi:hypothetical protein
MKTLECRLIALSLKGCLQHLRRPARRKSTLEEGARNRRCFLEVRNPRGSKSQERIDILCGLTVA